MNTTRKDVDLEWGDVGIICKELFDVATDTTYFALLEGAVVAKRISTMEKPRQVRIVSVPSFGVAVNTYGKTDNE